MIEHAEPGGVICTTRNSVTGAVVDVEREAALLGVERLGAVDVGDRHDHEFELEVHRADCTESASEEVRMKVLFCAGFSPIVPDRDASLAFYEQTLGIAFDRDDEIRLRRPPATSTA